MVLNREYYQRRKIYSSVNYTKNTEEYSENEVSPAFKLFIINGKPDFSDLNLIEYGWKRVNKHTPEQKKFIENTPGYKDYKETILYEGPQGRAVLHANYKKDNHKLGIFLNKYPEKDSDTMDVLKSMFEREWGFPLKESDKKENSDLIKKLESN